MAVDIFAIDFVIVLTTLRAVGNAVVPEFVIVLIDGATANAFIFVVVFILTTFQTTRNTFDFVVVLATFRAIVNTVDFVVVLAALRAMVNTVDFVVVLATL
ncbi:hypothetical protein CONLIGDRAFT_637140 [Coniochaeta ligniaria NRRL 30616]|uniref:Uncharacterized protein n=1 Tax=Coniochaeta ligniaria NRRL 30616 TaxID=1408157 RepID=A0A1J7J403_9PEZI|nr:hypothetical protein CONLIGDRAFT_637140 [Coniochaeta ligniaria NRRL 30616]